MTRAFCGAGPIIGREVLGCVELYRRVPEIDVVFALAIRSQREI